MKLHSLLLAVSLLAAGHGVAQVRPPAFMGGVPGLNQMRAIDMQRHQARTLLYREALEELRKNPKAADVPDCPPGTPAAAAGALCLAAARDLAASALSPAGASAPGSGRRIAVLIGNNTYVPPIPPLQTPQADVTRIAGILSSRFGFDARILKDAGKEQIVSELNRIAADVRPDDSVLLLYAGHGYLMDDTQMGFWIPVDASVKTAANWISNTDIRKLLKAIPSRQLMLVSDSCFSGSLTREKKVGSGGTAAEILNRRSVVVLSSGGDEPVSDEGANGHSVFAWNLIKTLESIGAVTPGVEVWRSVHGRVSKESLQAPQYGAVLSAGHSEGGDWLFRQP
jgi:uncharacterized caspase-like protein